MFHITREPHVFIEICEPGWHGFGVSIEFVGAYQGQIEGGKFGEILTGPTMVSIHGWVNFIALDGLLVLIKFR